MDDWHEETMQEMERSWLEYLGNLERTLDRLEKRVSQAAQSDGINTDEWCEATERILDELDTTLFSMRAPAWSSRERSGRLMDLKRRVLHVYTKYKSATAV